MNLIRDCLDKPVVDKDDRPMGRVDGIILELAEDRPPRVAWAELGVSTSAGRLSRHLGRLIKSLSKRLPDKGEPYRIPWNKIRIGLNRVTADLKAEQTPALEWELWLRRRSLEEFQELEMAKQEIHVERLIGKRVYALNGRSIGRLQEMRAEMERNQCYVQEFLVGSYAMFERLSALSLGRTLLALFGLGKGRNGYRVPWSELDLSDPEHPRLRCKVSELLPLQN